MEQKSKKKRLIKIVIGCITVYALFNIFILVVNFFTPDKNDISKQPKQEQKIEEKDDSESEVLSKLDKIYQYQGNDPLYSEDKKDWINKGDLIIIDKENKEEKTYIFRRINSETEYILNVNDFTFKFNKVEVLKEVIS